MLKTIIFIIFVLLAVFQDVIFREEDKLLAKIVIAIVGVAISISFLF